MGLISSIYSRYTRYTQPKKKTKKCSSNNNYKSLEWFVFKEKCRLENKQPYIEYLQSSWWQERRKQKLKSSHFTCQLCNNTTNLNVHHKSYGRLFREKNRDLQVLCRDCHKHIHGIADTDAGTSLENKAAISLANREYTRESDPNGKSNGQRIRDSVTLTI